MNNASVELVSKADVDVACSPFSLHQQCLRRVWQRHDLISDARSLHAVLRNHVHQAEELYVKFDNEARDLAHLPPVTSVHLNKQALDSASFTQDGCGLLVHVGTRLKSPSAVIDSPLVCVPTCFGMWAAEASRMEAPCNADSLGHSSRLQHWPHSVNLLATCTAYCVACVLSLSGWLGFRVSCCCERTHVACAPILNTLCFVLKSLSTYTFPCAASYGWLAPQHYGDVAGSGCVVAVAGS